MVGSLHTLCPHLIPSSLLLLKFALLASLHTHHKAFPLATPWTVSLLFPRLAPFLHSGLSFCIQVLAHSGPSRNPPDCSS